MLDHHHGPHSKQGVARSSRAIKAILSRYPACTTLSHPLLSFGACGGREIGPWRSAEADGRCGKRLDKASRIPALRRSDDLAAASPALVEMARRRFGRSALAASDGAAEHVILPGMTGIIGNRCGVASLGGYVAGPVLRSALNSLPPEGANAAGGKPGRTATGPAPAAKCQPSRGCG